MATLTNEQIEQKKQLLAEKVKEMKAIYDELVEAGAIEIPEEALGDVGGGVQARVIESFPTDEEMLWAEFGSKKPDETPKTPRRTWL